MESHDCCWLSVVTEVTGVVEEEGELELREALPKFKDPKGRDWLEGGLVLEIVHEGSMVSVGEGDRGVGSLSDDSLEGGHVAIRMTGDCVEKNN